MRTLAYAAAAYAAYAGCAEAFAPRPLFVPRVRATPATTLRTSEDAASVLARVDAMMSSAPDLAAPVPDDAAPACSAVVDNEDAASVMARVYAQSDDVLLPQPTPVWRWSGQDFNGYKPCRHEFESK